MGADGKEQCWYRPEPIHYLEPEEKYKMSHVLMSVDVTALVSRNATVASVELLDSCDLVPVVITTATGSAKRQPGDVHDESIAVDLAIGRALESLGRKLRKRGEDKVREASRKAEERQIRLRRKNADSAFRDLRERLQQVLEVK